MSSQTRLEDMVLQAAREGRAEDIHSLLSGLSPARVKTALHHRTWEQTRSWTPLTIAAQHGHLQVVKQLLEQYQVDADQGTAPEGALLEENVTALMCASRSGHLDIAKLLVSSGCALNLVSDTKRTALLFACEGNHLEVAKFLVESGARLEDADTCGNTCLMAACRPGSEALVEFLVEKGANVDVKTEAGETALHIAAQNNAAGAVDILLNKGEATMCSNSAGLSPLMLAARRGCKDVVYFFKDSSFVSRREKIASLTKLGETVSRYNNSEAYWINRDAILLRNMDPDRVFPKPL